MEKKGVIYAKDAEQMSKKVKDLQDKGYNLSNYVFLLGTHRHKWKDILSKFEIDTENMDGISAMDLIQYGIQPKDMPTISKQEVVYILIQHYLSNGNFDILEELSYLKKKRCGLDVFIVFKREVNKLKQDIENNLKIRGLK
jgi:hypothetical protein